MVWFLLCFHHFPFVFSEFQLQVAAAFFFIIIIMALQDGNLKLVDLEEAFDDDDTLKDVLEEIFDDFRKLLLFCAKALEDGDLKLVDALLERIWTSAPADELTGRFVKYYAEGIVRRAYGLHPSLPYFNLKVPDCQWLFYPFNYELKPNVLEGKKQVHLIDFYLPHLYYDHEQPYLFRGLSKVCGFVRVSVVLPPFLEKTVDFRQEGQYLARQAERVNIKLKGFEMVYANSLGEMDHPLMLDLMGRREGDEAVVIFYTNKLNRLVVKEGALEEELLRLAQINPDVVFIAEPNANHNEPNFIRRLHRSYSYYFYDHWAFGTEEENIKRGDIGNILGCEGKDRVVRHLSLHQWRSLFLSAALPIPLTPNHDFYGEEKGCLLKHNYFLSAWKFNSVDHFDSTSFNSLLREFNPGPETVEPIPVSKEHSSMNRLAAFAEIHDMLEDICFKYEIPLALTWLCGANITMSDSYKKLTLSLETVASYYIDYESQHFMQVCSEYNLEEGRGIAGKALQSNEPFLFEPDITQLEQPDYPFASAACEFGSHAVVAICLENNYTDDIYVIEFFIAPSKEKPMTPESLAMAYCIFTILNNMKKRFVTLRNHGSTKVDFQKGAETSNINQHVTMPMRSSLLASYEGDEIRNALPLNHNQQWGETSNSKTGDMQAAISLDPLEPRIAPILMPYYGVQQTQGPHDELVENADHTFEPKGGTKLVMKDSELTLLPGSASAKQSVGEGNSSFDLDRSRMDVARMVIKHQLPLNMVESEFFSILLKNLQPMFKLQSQEALSSDILCVYREEKGRLIEYFDKLSCRLNLTVSLWMDDLEKVTCSCFAVQFVDDNWVLKKKIIAFKSLGHENDFEPKIYLETLESLLAEWKFDKKLCSLTIRNFASSSLEIDEEIRKSWHRFEASYPLSTFYISFDGSISDLLVKDKSSELNASVSKTPTACLLQDIFNMYKKQSRHEKDCPFMNVKYDNNWRTCSLVLAIAAILDPRFKFDFVEFLYKTIYGDNSARIHLTKIRSALTEIFDDYANNFWSGKSLLDDPDPLASLNAEENIMDSFQRCYNSKRKNPTEASELDEYLQEPIIRPETEQFEVLGWWFEHALKFPTLGRMARDILAIPMSTVVQDSSLDEKILMDNPIFKGLDPQIIEAMICGKDWLESPKETSQASSAVEPSIRENNATPLAHPSELDHLSSESDEEEPSLPKGSLRNQARPTWSEEDVRKYLISPLTTKDVECLSKWQSHQIGTEVGPDKILDEKLAPLLLIPPTNDVHSQNPQQYYIDDTVVNQFFTLLKRRYDKYPHKYLKHHSFDSTAAIHLFDDKTKDFSRWVKQEELVGISKLFLPISLNQHWLLFCADIDNKNLLWLDSIEYDGMAYAYVKEVIRRWFLNFVLPTMGYNEPNDWPYIPTKVPLQNNSVDCGLFVMKYADCLTHGNYFPFTQDDMPHFRRRTFLDLYRGRIHSMTRRTQGSRGVNNSALLKSSKLKRKGKV
ncbi:Peptidase C48, SUMO/Sentrin/Ubl1 [Corchorus olitorius]|uniref:Peptidase C48, SUMO/Sentrin/Ubl1 n=1 Tax=Corchorus olitorius TaxID=93759 RepID=A0A1R3K836_9ROSI|nr:Peptidase C48, SUMO/Sentrin/Ubl1 [Corchorus olitorius]